MEPEHKIIESGTQDLTGAQIRETRNSGTHFCGTVPRTQKIPGPGTDMYQNMVLVPCRPVPSTAPADVMTFIKTKYPGLENPEKLLALLK